MGKTIGKVAAPLLVIALLFGGGAYLYHRMTSFREPSRVTDLEQGSKMNAINGQWQADEDLVCDIWRDEKGVYHASVTWTEAEDTITFWECLGAWSDEIDGFHYAEGVKQTNVYGKDGEMSSKTVYEDGKGSFYLKDNKVYWDDKKEQMAKGKAFTYVGEY